MKINAFTRSVGSFMLLRLFWRRGYRTKRTVLVWLVRGFRVGYYHNTIGHWPTITQRWIQIGWLQVGMTDETR